MKVKFKKLLPRAVAPTYSKKGDAGMDITATNISYEEKYGIDVYHTDLQIEIPEGYVGLIFPRSSISKTDSYLVNSVGVVDSSYRGEILIKMRSLLQYINPSSLKEFKSLPEYKVGDRVAQLVIIPYPTIELEEAKELSETDRGAGGFGSSGN